jgi:hypothetical protein
MIEEERKNREKEQRKQNEEERERREKEVRIWIEEENNRSKDCLKCGGKY